MKIDPKETADDSGKGGCGAGTKYPTAIYRPYTEDADDQESHPSYALDGVRVHIQVHAHFVPVFLYWDDHISFQVLAYPRGNRDSRIP